MGPIYGTVDDGIDDGCTRIHTRSGDCYADTGRNYTMVKLASPSPSVIDYNRPVRFKHCDSVGHLPLPQTYMVYGRSVTTQDLLILQCVESGELSTTSEKLIENVPDGVWTNVYPLDSSYPTKELADENALPGRLACVYVEQ